MKEAEMLTHLESELKQELVKDILPYWTRQSVDYKNGGFIGRINHQNQKIFDADKGVILNYRLLWTFSHCYKRFGGYELKELATRAYKYVNEYFQDEEQGGVYWMLDRHGNVIDDRKHIYAQAFAIYALSEYAHAFGVDSALEQAIEIFRLIEKHSADRNHSGYFEAFTRDWQLLDDVRLSDKDDNEPKSMNTHLHILEAYTNLYRYWPARELKKRLSAILDLFLDHIIRPDGTSLVTFMDVDWTPKSEVISYGHDIEASWLLTEAADLLGDYNRHVRLHELAIKMARAVQQGGIDEDGGMFNDGGPDGLIDDFKDWWPQAEAIVGFLNAYQLTGEVSFLKSAVKSLEFIQNYMLDTDFGEWYEKISREGKPCIEDKIRPWKGPYHNARACMEVMHRVESMRLNEKSDNATKMDEPSHNTLE